MGSGLVTVAEYENGTEAHIGKMVLETNGINAMVIGDELDSIAPYASMMNAQLQVCAEDVERAKEILESASAEGDNTEGGQ